MIIYLCRRLLKQRAAGVPDLGNEITNTNLDPVSALDLDINFLKGRIKK
jgi:hypothetical protein